MKALKILFKIHSPHCGKVKAHPFTKFDYVPLSMENFYQHLDYVRHIFDAKISQSETDVKIWGIVYLFGERYNCYIFICNRKLEITNFIVQNHKLDP